MESVENDDSRCVAVPRMRNGEKKSMKVGRFGRWMIKWSVNVKWK